MSTSLHTTPQSRERRQWTQQEDELLRQGVQQEEPNNAAPSKWHAIAQHVPNRTNKDCRKRWYAKMSSDIVKGGWAPDEDQRLLSAIDCFGTRWSLVASMVQTRNSDQCAKRWCDTLNPNIDRTAWSLEADELLVQAVREHGTAWTKIVQMYFPGRTGLAAKNRYVFSPLESRLPSL
ncbi:Homeodomain-like protein [Roridomyces roridus]|uniref:Homeodomain-like protein n=1 Tax=Roridomyces roridus TaxID=1738132 RepID=A0AAD7B4C2_9AGAR|nr:Homeodomain-like protein [Roridomyces roridus]